MKKPLQFLKLPFALQNGVLVHVSTVTGGRRPDCLCPECGHPLIARKGQIKQHHFAHDPGSQCNLESALHWIGKKLIFDGIQTALKEGKPIALTWQCAECPDLHEGNLLKLATSATLECNLGQARPDILLANDKANPVAAIEVIVTHPLEDAARAFYRERNIQIIEIKLATFEAADRLRDLTRLLADAVSVCLRPKCSCGKPMSPKTLHIVSGPCYRCGAAMNVAFVDREGYSYGPKEFSSQEIQIARNGGCLLQKRYSRAMRQSYFANICGTCGAFAGEYHLHKFEELADAATGTAVGHFCHHCNKHIA